MVAGLRDRLNRPARSRAATHASAHPRPARQAPRVSGGCAATPSCPKQRRSPGPVLVRKRRVVELPASGSPVRKVVVHQPHELVPMATFQQAISGPSPRRASQARSGGVPDCWVRVLGGRTSGRSPRPGADLRSSSLRRNWGPAGGTGRGCVRSRQVSWIRPGRVSDRAHTPPRSGVVRWPSCQRGDARWESQTNPEAPTDGG